MNDDQAVSAATTRAQVKSDGALHVLTLTPFYPSAGNDASGCFVAEPLAYMEQNDVVSTVFAGQPFYRTRVVPSAEFPARWQSFFSFPGGLGLSSSGAFLFTALLAKIRKLHSQDPFDIIHAHAALPCGHAAMLLGKALGIPFVVTVHGLDAFSDNQVTGVAGRWCRRVSQLVYRSACAVICISEKVKQQVKTGSPRANAGVIYNGVDPQRFFPAFETTEPLILLSVGNLIPIKGHDLLLRAFASISSQFPRAELTLIGDGPERSRLVNLAAELKVSARVRFLGRQSRERVAEAMRQCCIFALPSRYEGLGCVYLEAMSSGKPVIACRGQGIDEVIQHQKTGWLVEPGDMVGLANAISKLMQDTQMREVIGEAARKTILSEFTLAQQAARLASIYRECLP